MPSTPQTSRLRDNLSTLSGRIVSHIAGQPPSLWPGVKAGLAPSVVLFLLDEDRYGRPCIILNKRSQRVVQPGDLCFPGGSVSPRLDRYLGKCLMFPGSPLRQWPLWGKWRRYAPQALSQLAFLLAAGLREGIEEMRINPFRLEFLGPLPPDRLLVYSRILFPFALRVRGQRRFRINWEVEEVLRVPLVDFLNPGNYGKFVIPNPTPIPGRDAEKTRELLFFNLRHHQPKPEILWGITLRIIMGFLEAFFQFTPPELERLPMVNGNLSRPYLLNLRHNGPLIRDDDLRPKRPSASGVDLEKIIG